MRTLVRALCIVWIGAAGLAFSVYAQSAPPTPPGISICDSPQYRGTAIYHKYCDPPPSQPQPSQRQQTEPSLSAEEIEKYSDLVTQLAPYGDDDWIASIRTAPQTPAELSRRLDEIARQLDDLMPPAWRSFHSTTWERDAYRRSIKQARLDIQLFSRSLESNAQGQESVARESEQLKRQADTLERDVNWAMATASRLSASTVETRKTVIEWLYVAAPADSRIVEEESWKHGHDVPVPALPPQASAAPTPHLRAAEAAQAGPAAAPNYPYANISLSGSNEERLATLAPLADNLEKWSTESAAARLEAARLKPTVASLAEQSTTLQRRLAGMQNLYEKTADRRDYLRSQVRAEAQRLRAANSRALVRAVENFTWKMYKEHYVTPDVLAFYEENKRWYKLSVPGRLDDDQVKRLFARGKASLDILGSRFTGLQHFNEVQKQTLDLLQDEMHFIAEAPRIVALATPGEIQAYGASLDAMRQNSSYNMMKEAGAGQFSISPDQLEHGWIPQQMFGIAKRLGLVKSSSDQ